MVKPAARKAVVHHLQEQHGLSQRRACSLAGCNRMTARYRYGRSEEDQVRQRLVALAENNPGLVYRMLCGMLRLQGWCVNPKKVYRLYREEALQLRRKGKRRLKSEGRGLPQPAMAPNQEWIRPEGTRILFMTRSVTGAPFAP